MRYRQLGQVEESAAAFGVELDDETLRGIEELLGDVVVYEGGAAS